MKIALISCSRTKLKTAARARELYRGERFMLTLALVERSNFDDFFILSSRHGLIRPDKVIEPYDDSFLERSALEQDAWAKQVAEELTSLGLTSDNLTVYADDTYMGNALRKYLPVASYPLQGMNAANQVSFLSKKLSI